MYRRRLSRFFFIKNTKPRTAARPIRLQATPIPALAPSLRTGPSSGLVGEALAGISIPVDVVTESVSVEASELVEDGEVSSVVGIGDQDARAIAEKVSVGLELAQSWVPQHSHTSAVEFHWIHVVCSPADR